MNSVERRREIYRILLESQGPVSAASLAERFKVTRQIIVKDMGLLKAEQKEIISTSRGYLLNRNIEKCTRSIYVCHSKEEMEEELKLIVDLGGKVLTTYIEHGVYGSIGEALNIKCRKDIHLFMERIHSGECEPLLKLTNGKHTHLIEAEDEETLDEICQELKQKGYLL